MLSTPGVEFIGEVDESQKADLLGGAQALLFPIDWPEPFGMVLIEAMACGTPIIAWDHGSVPEIVEHGQQRLHRQQHQGRGGSRGRERDAGSSRVPRRVRGEVHGRPDGTGLRLDL